MHGLKDPGVVASHLRSLSDDVRAGDLLVLALERAILRDPDFFVLEEDGEGGDPRPRFEVSDENADRLGHIADWIVSDVLDDAPWLHRTDAAGRPLKLLKIGSVARAASEADKAMRRRASASAGSDVEVGEGEERYLDLADGWSVVRLRTPEALDRESSVMQHCIGHGAYDRRLAEDGHLLLSLRDPSGHPHATIDATSHPSTGGTVRIVQVQGKQNKPPQGRYMLRLAPLLDMHPLSDAILRRLGYVLDALGGRHLPGNLPDDVHILQNVTLDMAAEGSRMPAVRLVVDGTLLIAGTPGTPVVLPSVLHARGVLQLEGDFVLPPGADLRAGMLRLRGGSLRGLPDGLEIAGAFEIDGCDVGPLPSGLSVAELILKDCGSHPLPPDIRIAIALTCISAGPCRLPDGMRLERLRLHHAHVDVLPDDLRVSESLTVEGGSVSSLGRGTRTLDLVLRDLPCLEWLPDDLVVDGSLRIVGKGISRLPPGLEPASIFLSGVEGMVLPRMLKLQGTLSIEDSEIASWPISTIVPKLEISGSDRVRIPAGVDALTIDVRCTSGSVFVESGIRVSRQLKISGFDKVVFSRGVHLRGDLALDYVDHAFLHGRMRVDGTTSISGCNGIRISERFLTHDLAIVRCLAIVLPRRLAIVGDVLFDTAGFERTPDRLDVEGSLRWIAKTDVRVPAGTRVGRGATIDARFGRVVVGAGCRIGGNLNLEAQEIELGERLDVSGNLRGDAIEDLPAEARIGGFYTFGRLRSIGTHSNFVDLTVSMTPLAELPEGLVVDNDLDISLTDVSSLPADLVVHGTLVVPDRLHHAPLPTGVRGARDRHFRRVPHQLGVPTPDSSLGTATAWMQEGSCP